MKDAKPETKEFINTVIKTFEIMDLKTAVKGREEILLASQAPTAKLYFDKLDQVQELYEGRTNAQKKKDKKRQIEVFNSRVKNMVRY